MSAPMASARFSVTFAVTPLAEKWAKRLLLMAMHSLLMILYMQDAADALEKHIYEGLYAHFGFEPHIVNVLPIDSFPQYYKDALIKQTEFRLVQRTDHVNLGFCNVKLVRNSFIEQSIYKNLVQYFEKHQTKEKRVLIVYSATASFLRAVKRVKEIYPDIIVCDIIADLPVMTNLSSKKSALLKAYSLLQESRPFNFGRMADSSSYPTGVL